MYARDLMIRFLFNFLILNHSIFKNSFDKPKHNKVLFKDSKKIDKTKTDVHYWATRKKLMDN